jgi:hypothetical protein
MLRKLEVWALVAAGIVLATAINVGLCWPIFKAILH